MMVDGMQCPQTAKRSSVSRMPAVPVAFAFAAGILVDSQSEIPLAGWLITSGFLMAAAILGFWMRRHAAVTGVLILLFWVSLGGVRHHALQAVRREDNIAMFARQKPQPVCVIGQVIQAPELLRADHSASTPVWSQVDRTRILVRCELLRSCREEKTASGILQLSVTGHALGLNVGDKISAWGNLLLPGPPKNPLTFDYQRYLSLHRIDARLRCDHPEQVRRLESSSRWIDRLAKFRSQWRWEIRSVLINHLSREHAVLATSLLLGDRTSLPGELRESFVHSGTVHLLAISGLHVGILLGIVAWLCRVLRLNLGSRTVCLLLVVLAYAFLTNHRPPVLRASLLAAIVLGGLSFGRRMPSQQVLAFCALLLLIWSPADLFDVGAQLSFVAVLAILWVVEHLRRKRGTAAAAQDLDRSEEFVPKVLRTCGRSIRDAGIISLAVWSVTLPLSAHHFHIVAPSGIVLNVLLIPVIALVLALGYVMIFAAVAHPILAVLPAMLLSAILGLMQSVIAWFAVLPGGHLSIAPIPGWWLAGYYGVIAVGTGLMPWHPAPKRCLAAGLVWVALGQGVGLLPEQRTGLRCTFLSQGHGCSVLIETPQGQTVLYDAGSFADGRRAAETVQSVLWARGCSRIDLLLISHADADHYNGVPRLLEFVPVGRVAFAQSFLDFDQEYVRDVCESASLHDVPMTILQAGDVLRLADQITMEVLHPAADFESDQDNQQSLVTLLRYGQASVLLLGDIEGDGLKVLQQQPVPACSVMLSPHHGTRTANPVSLSAWARPKHVVISTGDLDAMDRLRTSYSKQTRLYSTANDGAVTFQLSRDGEVRVSQHISRIVPAPD